jgi:hypothetical protein
MVDELKMRMDYSGPEPVLVVDRGYGEERLTMDEFRAIAEAAGLRERVEDACAGQEFVHTLIQGGLAPDAERDQGELT